MAPNGFRMPTLVARRVQMFMKFTRLMSSLLFLRTGELRWNARSERVVSMVRLSVPLNNLVEVDGAVPCAMLGLVALARKATASPSERPIHLPKQKAACHGE